AVLFDYESGAPYVPLQSLSSARASFEVWNSPLSEQATLGFEFGYSIQAPETLVLWEAQYGDFVDVPQALIDVFISTARTKWGQATGLAMLLPHGYEGQGPEHSSARLERWLQLSAEDNLRIANCTTAPQYFHLLRRQAHLLEICPVPAEESAARLRDLPALEQVAWLQEEPRNMGAWTCVAPRLRDVLGEQLPLYYIGRTRRASPAEGSHHWHAREQTRLIEA